MIYSKEVENMCTVKCLSLIHILLRRYSCENIASANDECLKWRKSCGFFGRFPGVYDYAGWC